MKLLSRMYSYARYFGSGYGGSRKSARVLVFQDGKLLVMQRKRLDRQSKGWIEYYSIPGGGIEAGEKPEAAAVRELKEEMGLAIRILSQVAHRSGGRFEHFVYLAELADPAQKPALMPDSEEALYWHTETNQFIPGWVEVDSLTPQNLHYYAEYLGLIQQLARGEKLQDVLHIDAD